MIVRLLSFNLDKNNLDNKQKVQMSFNHEKTVLKLRETASLKKKEKNI